jgi:hypothetical protein
MMYVATQRCPCCKSTATTVSLTELPRSHKYHEPGVSVRWTCSNCHTNFEPSNSHESSPVLMCAKCGLPTRHTFLRADRGIFKSMAAEVQLANSPVLHELYACACGEVRLYGSVNLEIPKLSLVTRDSETLLTPDSAVSA